MKQPKSSRALFYKLDNDALRIALLLAIILIGAYVAFFRLGADGWKVDEPIYRDAGLAYVRDGDFSLNREHPFLAKYILGATQIVFGSSESEVVRLPAATAALSTGLILFAFARRVAGYWTGVMALALWTISPLTLELGRTATLDVFVVFFSSLALYLGWRWAESRNWKFAVLAGVAIGLATASKPLGILFLPAILFVGLLKIGLSRCFVFQSTLIGLAAATVALATYAPLGSEALSAIQYMFEFQGKHNANGHPTDIDGVIYTFPPWWAHLYFQWDVYGTLASTSLGIAVAIAFLRHRPLELYLLAAVLVPFLFLSFYMQFKLAGHFYAYQPPLILLVALAAGALASWQGIKGGILTLMLLAPFVYLGVEAVEAPSHIHPNNYAKIADYLEDTQRDRDTILIGGRARILQAELPKAHIIENPEGAHGEEIDEVIVDKKFSKQHSRRPVEDYIETNRSNLELTYTIGDKKKGDQIQVYSQ